MFFKEEEEAQSAVSKIKNYSYSIKAIDERNISRKPKAPFNTSMLQQTANSQINFSASQTMTVAQGLYMGVDIGLETIALITYMRTDSISLSNDTLSILRDKIKSEYGEEYVPKDPIIYKTKKKNAQEAHEAIRPTDINIHPESIKDSLTEEQLSLIHI